MRFNPSTLDTLRSIPIESILDRCQVERRGKAVFCPFHTNERTPAAYIYPGALYCFACGQRWDSIAIYQSLFSLDFVAAVESLAADFGVHLDRPDPRKAAECERQHRSAIEKAERIIAARDAYRRSLIERRNTAYDLERRAIRLAQLAEDPERAELLCEIVFKQTGAGLDAEARLELLEQASAEDLCAWFQDDSRSNAA